MNFIEFAYLYGTIYQEVIGIAIKKAGSDGVGWQWVKKLSLSAGLLHI